MNSHLVAPAPAGIPPAPDVPPVAALPPVDMAPAPGCSGLLSPPLSEHPAQARAAGKAAATT
ncbi:MAG TPA: hypothetical protein VHB79_24015 [Polyangiaceae bacterium]|nr:hypothetical protein [Polyangiaceae bacterium]